MAEAHAAVAEKAAVTEALVVLRAVPLAALAARVDGEVAASTFATLAEA